MKRVLCLRTPFPRVAPNRGIHFNIPVVVNMTLPQQSRMLQGSEELIECAPCQEPCSVPGKYTRSLTYSSIRRYENMSHGRVAYCFGAYKVVLLPQFCRIPLSAKTILNDNIKITSRSCEKDSKSQRLKIAFLRMNDSIINTSVWHWDVEHHEGNKW